MVIYGSEVLMCIRKHVNSLALFQNSHVYFEMFVLFKGSF